MYKPENIAAITGLGIMYPEFISINAKDNGVVVITTRESPTDGKCGRTVDIVLSNTQWQDLLGQIANYKFIKRYERG